MDFSCINPKKVIAGQEERAQEFDELLYAAMKDNGYEPSEWGSYPWDAMIPPKRQWKREIGEFIEFLKGEAKVLA